MEKEKYMETKDIDMSMIINTLSEKLSIPTTHLWEVAIKGMRLEGIIDLTLSVLYVLLVILSIYITYQLLKKDPKDKDDEEPGGGLILFSIAINIIWWFVLGLLLYPFSGFLLKILAPEYSVIKQLFSL